jgi:hypothetical protein
LEINPISSSNVSTLDKKMLIVSEKAYRLLIDYARSNRLKPDPSQILQTLTQQNGIYFAAFIADRPEQIKHLRVDSNMFEKLQNVQREVNMYGRNFSLLDIVTAQMVIHFGADTMQVKGEMVAIAQAKEGLSTVTRDDNLQHWNLIENQLYWSHPARIIFEDRSRIDFEL